MGVKVVQAACLQSFIIPRAVSSTRALSGSCALAYHLMLRPDHYGAGALLCSRRRRRRKEHGLPRAFSASLDTASPDDDDGEEEVFIRRLQELTPEIKLIDNGNEQEDEVSQWLGIQPEPPDWPERDQIVPANVELNANSVGLPRSLRIIEGKKWEEEFMDASESACSSVKKAFSSMVFIVHELQSYALQMRQLLSYQDLERILDRVRREMHASFVWLFQKVFSCTPTLMLSLMILLANYSVYSMGHNTAIAATPQTCTSTTLSASHHHLQEQQQQQQQQQKQRPGFESTSTIKITTFSAGKTASVGGGGGGGGKVRPVAGATDDGRPDGSPLSSSIYNPRSSTTASTPEQLVVEEVEVEDEQVVWNRVVEEASRMQASLRDATLMDADLLQSLVSPVTVELEPDDHSNHFQAELMYQKALSHDPENTLFLCNFAQFLYLVLQDHDRAEYYFKRAVKVQPADAEALDKYASFLWLVRKDLTAAEETYLEAIAADPGNPLYASHYAHFLWNTGGEDTCYPLDDS
ncbi:TPR-like protein [Dioscorea alata]|uniref:TPR-like protein n=1 Tax=Dioscorea alata TaxID=55571 RepID=A0ACB7VGJ5_DIOAL|nr:TPR-like protein [Dioscorea alata]